MKLQRPEPLNSVYFGRERVYQFLLLNSLDRNASYEDFKKIRDQRRAFYAQYSESLNMFRNNLMDMMTNVEDGHVDVLYVASLLKFAAKHGYCYDVSMSGYTYHTAKSTLHWLTSYTPILNKVFFDDYKSIKKKYNKSLERYSINYTMDQILLTGMLRIIIKVINENIDPTDIRLFTKMQDTFNKAMYKNNPQVEFKKHTFVK